MTKFYWKYYGGTIWDFLRPWLLLLAVWVIAFLFLTGWFSAPVVIERDQYGQSLALTLAPDSVQASPSAPAEGKIPCIPPDRPEPAGSQTNCPGEIGLFLAQLHDAYYDGDGTLKPAGDVNLADLDNMLSRADPPKMATSARPTTSNDTQTAAATEPLNWMRSQICTIDRRWGVHRPVVAAIAAAYQPCKARHTDWPLVRYDWFMSTPVAIVMTWLLLLLGFFGPAFLAYRSWKVRKAYRWLYLSPLP